MNHRFRECALVFFPSLCSLARGVSHPLSRFVLFSRQILYILFRIIINSFLKIDLGEREKHQFVVPLMYLSLFLICALTGIEQTTLAYQDSALTD